MSELTNQMSALDIFASTQESFDDAKKKSAAESGNRVKYFRISGDGTVAVRILPLAPVIDAEGNVLPMDRKGYEYPVKELVLKIKGDNNKQSFVNVCNAKYAFPQLQSDLIDKYVELALSLYLDDEKLCKKVKETSFNGGLKWDSKRCMYILDLDKRNDGIQVFQLSYSQYKELEERKLQTWAKLNKKGNVPCPISSITDAFPVEITRKTENKKTNYSFNIDTLSPKDELTEDELQNLLNMPRLPEVLYRYTRYHLEATIAYLNQFDETTGMEVMKEPEIKDCINQIKLCLPADDQSHFNMNGKNGGDSSDGGSVTLDSLWDLYDKLCDEGLGDKSEEGQNLRTAIKEFIEDNDLDVSISRTKTNETLLNDIQDILDGEAEEDKAPASKPSAKKEKVEEPEEEEDDAPAADAPSSEEAEEEEETPAPTRASRRRERNDDTSEPAAEAPARPERRAARPHRRR